MGNSFSARNARGNGDPKRRASRSDRNAESDTLEVPHLGLSKESHPEFGVRDAVLTDNDFANLNAVLGHQISENTRKSYSTQWRDFSRWAIRRRVSSLPAHPAHVAAYLAERMEVQGHKPATLRAAAAALSYMHRNAKLNDPCAESEVRNTLRSAVRKAGLDQRQAQALTSEDLRSIRDAARIPRVGRGGRIESQEVANQRAAMDIAIICLMRDAMLRVSEAASLRWEDLTDAGDGTGRLIIRRSKTDAEGESVVLFVSPPTMSALAAIRGEADEGDSMFRLSSNQIVRRIKQAAMSAGLGDGYSGHSPRVGMAQDLARIGIELPRLMTAGRWRSPRMPALYIRNETAARGAVAQYYGVDINRESTLDRGEGGGEGREKPSNSRSARLRAYGETVIMQDRTDAENGVEMTGKRVKPCITADIDDLNSDPESQSNFQSRSSLRVDNSNLLRTPQKLLDANSTFLKARENVALKSYTNLTSIRASISRFTASFGRFVRNSNHPRSKVTMHHGGKADGTDKPIRRRLRASLPLIWMAILVASAPLLFVCSRQEHANPVLDMMMMIKGLTLVSDAPGTLTVAWDHAVPIPTEYRVSWARSDRNFGSSEQDHRNVYPKDNQVVLVDLKPGREYKVRVRALYVDEHGDAISRGPWSETVLLVVAEDAAHAPQDN